MARFRPSRLLALAATATVLWGLHVDVSCAQSFSVYGLNYNARKGPDWADADVKCKSPDEIKLDMKTIKTVTNNVRLYSLVDCNQGALVIPAALNAGLKVSVGLWVSDDPAVFQAEKAKLKELIVPERGIFSVDKIFDIHVGSEAIYRKEVTAETNIGYLNEVKDVCRAHANSASIPVTIADIGDTYLAYPDLIAAVRLRVAFRRLSWLFEGSNSVLWSDVHTQVDIVSANGFPFWEKWAANASAAHFFKRMDPLFRLAKDAGKGMFISETGWASGGVSAKSSKASPANAKVCAAAFATNRSVRWARRGRR